MPKKTSGGTATKAQSSKAKSTKSTKTSKAKQTDAASNGAGQAAAAAEAKRAAREAQTAEQQQAVVDRVVNGDEKLAVVAKDLKITSGKAAFLIMLHRVEQGEVPKITGKNDEALLKAINVARLKADEHSSWGWLAARSGKSEGFIKTGLAKLGLYKPREENIASKRAGSKPAAAANGSSGKKSTTTGKSKSKKVRGNA